MFVAFLYILSFPFLLSFPISISMTGIGTLIGIESFREREKEEEKFPVLWLRKRTAHRGETFFPYLPQNLVSYSFYYSFFFPLFLQWYFFYVLFSFSMRSIPHLLFFFLLFVSYRRSQTQFSEYEKSQRPCASAWNARLRAVSRECSTSNLARNLTYKISHL